MKNFYIYIYLDQRKPGIWTFEDKIFDYQPFYIGKGTRNRLDIHLYKSMMNVKSIKNSIIKSIIEETGELPIHYKIYEKLDESESFDIETKLINHFGRLDNKSGILGNHTDGGEGQSGCLVPHIKKRKIYYQYDLDGNFIKKWNYGKDISNFYGTNSGNISTSIKRNGTWHNSIWSYEYLGEKIESKIKYQMPYKYENIKQIDKKTGVVIAVYSNADEAEIILGIKGSRNKIVECLKNNEIVNSGLEDNKKKTWYRSKSYLGYLWEI